MKLIELGDVSGCRLNANHQDSICITEYQAGEFGDGHGWAIFYDGYSNIIKEYGLGHDSCNEPWGDYMVWERTIGDFFSSAMSNATPKMVELMRGHLKSIGKLT